MAAVAAVGAGCFGKTYWTPTLASPEAVARTVPGTVKVHLQSGELALLRVWQADTGTRRLSGLGTWFNAARQPVDSGRVSIPFDSIALVETHQADAAHPLGLSGLAVWTAIMAPLTAACVADPKSCFGSCPTFYARDTATIPQAEGFSASFARALEATDLDALGPVGARDGRAFVVRMTNEALETHAVRSLYLLAAPRPPGGRTFATTDGRLLPTTGLTPAVRCAGPEGDCTRVVYALDRSERRSLADSMDLAARETVNLTFPAVSGPAALVLAARQTLVSTFLFYQTMAYFGHNGGAWLAGLERAGPAGGPAATGMARVLGGIEVFVTQGDAWTSAGEYAEAGPIATDVQVFPLPSLGHSSDSVRIRLRMARGAWRIDWIALARVGLPVTAVRLEPAVVLRASTPNHTALHALRDTSRYLVTYPGDTYRVEFHLPDADTGWELFLESRGYYYEWMRAEWLRETDPAMALRAIHDPEGMLRALAPVFKQVEPLMERRFWDSRFGR